MTVRVHNFSVSLDGFGAGPEQSLENPMGIGSRGLHSWLFKTASFNAMHGGEGGSTGPDNDFAMAANKNVGAEIMGRGKFGPADSWQDESWRGWWGEETPFPYPVFVLSHSPRKPFTTEDGTVFTFVSDLDVALKEATSAAGDKDITIGGGASLVNQALKAGIIDEMHYVVSPVLLGSGARLFEGVDNLADLYECKAVTTIGDTTHVELRKRA